MYRCGILIVVAALIGAVAAGCQDYKWQWSFESPEQLQKTEKQALDEGKMVLLFYKWYLDSDANRMHGEVLADNRVGALFADTLNIVIDKSAGPAYERYLAKYGVSSPPACILVAPDGRYKVFTGYIPAERFVELVKAAKAQLTEAPRRTAPSKVTP
ncbi:MAG: hypothetical protein HY718_03370 [Planctomycetes bacterium]|nr:hypothetical protein [Planctomycetota bacterium]